MSVPAPVVRSLLPIMVLAAAGVSIAAAEAGESTIRMFVYVGFCILLDWLVSPWLITRTLRARWLVVDGGQYLTATASEARLASTVMRRTAGTGSPLRVGIVEDPTPNAFTYGRTAGSARIVVTSGLLQRLDDDELDAVICHELGHVRHHDAALMTALMAIPLLLQTVARWFVPDDGDDDDEGEGLLIALVLFVAYLACELLLLAFSRAREFAADRWSSECTMNGDALATALTKISESQVPADRPGARSEKLRLVALARPGKQQRRGRVRELLSTHPSIDRRLGAIVEHDFHTPAARTALARLEQLA